MAEALKSERRLSARGQQKFRVPGTYLMGWLSEVLMRLPVANASLLLGNVSSIAAQISCVMSPCDIAHSCGHPVECAAGKTCFVAGHHA
jgi:hypothetical protein